MITTESRWTAQGSMRWQADVCMAKDTEKQHEGIAHY